MPALPSWVSIHPLLVHFPIALLVLAPLIWAFVTVREYRDANSKPASSSAETLALGLLWLGTVSCMLAVESGEAAGRLAGGGAIKAILERHEELAETTETIAIVVSFLFTALWLLRRLPKLGVLEKFHFVSSLPKFVLPFRLVGLAGLTALVVLVAKTAHEGGQLVHVHGVRAQMAATPADLPISNAGDDED